MLNAPIILMHLLPHTVRSSRSYQRTMKWLFLGLNIPAFALNCIDIEFFKFTNKRSTVDLFSMLGYGDDMQNLIPAFFSDYWHIILIFILLSVLTIVSYRTTKIDQTKVVLDRSYLIKHGCLMLVAGCFFFLLARNGFQTQRADIITASKYEHSENTSIVLNTTYTVIKTWGKNPLEEKKYFAHEEIDTLFRPIKHFNENSGIQQKTNVVVLILESFSQEYIGFLNGSDTTYTPFLDSLFAKSLVFKNAFANGTRSIEALPSVLAGIPSLMSSPYISSSYSNNGINSLASILREEGYQTSFFHGATNGSMAFDRFCSISGVEKYYGRSEYNNEADFNGSWGIHDEEFLSFFADELGKHQEPFLSGLFTISSHHPFILPKKHEGKFDGPTPMHKTVRYTDYAVKQFFEKAKNEKWFDNTLFVITADHTFHSANNYYHSKVGRYDIPIVFYHNKGALPELRTELTQQIDIFPSVLDYLGYNKPFYAFGNSVFDNDPSNNFWISSLDDVVQYTKDDYVLQFGDETCMNLYNFKQDSLLKKNLISDKPLITSQLEKNLKAVWQTYSNDLIRNKTTVFQH